MDGFTSRTPAEPTDAEEGRAFEAVDRLSWGGRPVDRMEAGLAFALTAGRDPAGVAEVEDRRFAMAFARGLARMRTAGDEAPAIGSIDWARTFCVDASVQREAERSVGMDLVDRRARHRWGAAWTVAEPWVQAGVAPSTFGKVTEEELVSMAAGRFHEIPPGRGRGLETALMGAMAPAMPSMEARLHLAAGTPPAATADRLADGAAAADLAAFGPLPEGRDGVAMATLGDRIDLAARSAEVGHRDARGLFDPTPGRHPFAVGIEHEAAADSALAGGASSLARVARAVEAFSAEAGPAVDGGERARLRSALSRLAARGPDAVTGLGGDVRTVLADVLAQRAAADVLSGRGSGAAAALERMVSNAPEGREGARFSTAPSERRDVELVAAGRFGELDDRRGWASSVRNTMWRASMSSSPAIDRAVERSAQAPRPSIGKGPARPAPARTMPLRGSAGR